MYDQDWTDIADFVFKREYYTFFEITILNWYIYVRPRNVSHINKQLIQCKQMGFFSLKYLFTIWSAVCLSFEYINVST